MPWIDTSPPQRRRQLETALDADGAEHLRYAAGDPDFAMFLLVADAAAGRRLGVSIFDLPDACWRDFYDDGLTPMEAVATASESE
jgi:exopolysaccharide biosynthesis protein